MSTNNNWNQGLRNLKAIDTFDHHYQLLHNHINSLIMQMTLYCTVRCKTFTHPIDNAFQINGNISVLISTTCSTQFEKWDVHFNINVNWVIFMTPSSSLYLLIFPNMTDKTYIYNMSNSQSSPSRTMTIKIQTWHVDIVLVSFIQ